MGLFDSLKSFKKKYIDNAPPSVDGRDPYWVTNRFENDKPNPEYEFLSDELYEEDHFYSVDLGIWVRRGDDGRYYKSMPFEQWDIWYLEDNSTEEVEPEHLITRDEYEEYGD